jgi:hypothetical protein
VRVCFVLHDMLNMLVYRIEKKRVKASRSILEYSFKQNNT